MTSEPIEAREAEQARALLAPLRDAPSAWDEARADAVWDRIVEARGADRRRRVALTFAAAAAAAGLAVGLALTSARRPPAPAPVAESAAPLAPGAPLRGRVALPSGAQVEAVGAGIRVATATADETRLDLRDGAVESQVPHLAAGQRYVVETPLAAVEVRGTRFTVEHHPEGATEVRVTEGRVEVRPVDGRPGRLVGPGETLRVQRLDRAGAEAAEDAGDLSQAVAILQRLAEQAPTDLERRNHALRAGRLLDAHGPVEDAVAWWARLRVRHPEGAHAEEFAFRHADALRRAGRLDEARAAGAALRARFPDGARAAETRGW
ncbi:MAG: FecR domain-containing protein [Myxococcales bacterium]|nr:FecR domain-containing protein [Myxococcales bacterium]